MPERYGRAGSPQTVQAVGKTLGVHYENGSVMYHTPGAVGSRRMLCLQQTGRKLISDLRAALKSFVLCEIKQRNFIIIISLWYFPVIGKLFMGDT